MSRTIDDFDSIVKREMIKAKQEKGLMRVQKFRADYTEFRAQFEGLKTETALNVRFPRSFSSEISHLMLFELIASQFKP